ncbi:MAG TPA: ABC transporter substrate-binding protein [Streptosporangiaceae bacterium]
MRFARPGAKIAALAVVTAVAAAGCGSSNGSSAPSSNTNAGAFGKVPPAASGPQHAGTMTWAEAPGTAPTWILPITTSAAFNVDDTTQFSYQMWRPLYWFSNGVEPTETPSMSLAEPPKWSNGDKTVSVTLKSGYKWSDGQPVTAKDVLFFFDEIKAGIKEDPSNWGPYSPGLGLPDDVASVSTPAASTIVFNLKQAVNPGWFFDDQLSSLNPMPSHAWAKASASGPLLDFTVPANAKSIFDFLNNASKSEATYTTNPLWQVVDGPYKLTQFNSSSGAFTMSPNPGYGGPHAKQISTLQAVPFTSDTAEFNAVRAGSIDVGYLPLTDIKQVPAVQQGGYNVFGYPGFSFAYVAYNFLDKTGSFNKIISQLYFRQAFAHLEDEQGYIRAFFGGAGGPAYGPIPSIPKSPYVPSNAVTDPYPFSVSAAVALLKSHGWAVHPGGTDTCAKPGSGAGECGAGIPAGTKLSFNLIYTTAPAVVGEMVTDLASQAAKAGITITLKSSNFNYIVTYYDNPVPSGKPYINKWAMEDFGGFTDSTYPTTLSIFNGPGSLNEGTYSDSTADKLINASVNSSDPTAVKNEASYLTKSQPGLFQPNGDYVAVWKKTISGNPASFSNQTQSYLTPEYWYFTK